MGSGQARSPADPTRTDLRGRLTQCRYRGVDLSRSSQQQPAANQGCVRSCVAPPPRARTGASPRMGTALTKGASSRKGTQSQARARKETDSELTSCGTELRYPGDVHISGICIPYTGMIKFAVHVKYSVVLTKHVMVFSELHGLKRGGQECLQPKSSSTLAWRVGPGESRSLLNTCKAAPGYSTASTMPVPHTQLPFLPQLCCQYYAGTAYPASAHTSPVLPVLCRYRIPSYSVYLTCAASTMPVPHTQLQPIPHLCCLCCTSSSPPSHPCLPCVLVGPSVTHHRQQQAGHHAGRSGSAAANAAVDTP